MASAAAPTRPTLKAQRFLDANTASPLVYQSTEGDGCFCKLASGETFDLSAKDSMSIANVQPRWRHLVAA